MKIADVTRRCQFSSVFQGISSKFVFLLWAVFGGFILHFLLSRYLTVLLKPRYEKFIETAEDLIEEDITPFSITHAYIYIMNESSITSFKQLAQKMTPIKDIYEFENMVCKVISNGSFAQIGSQPWIPRTCISNNGTRVPIISGREWRLKWHRSPEPIEGLGGYVSHLTNKKWPLREVLTKLSPNS